MVFQIIIMENKYIPQFDGLRAIAVLLVIISHWMPSMKVLNILPNGELGVCLFFVLSGFLITRILLQMKNEMLEGKISFWGSIKLFYWKRTLRIFPIYYLSLLVLLFFNNETIKSSFFWNVTYLTNFYIVFINKGWIGCVSHLWTLAVEEQFYLFWPIIILLAPFRYLTKLIIVIICLGVLYRVTNFNNYYLYKYFTPGCFDALGTGAFIALNYDYIQCWFLKHKVYLSALIMTFSALIITNYIKYDYFTDIYERFIISIFSGLLVFKAISGFNRPLAIVLENPFIMYIGRISYGLYLYHNLIPFIYIPDFHSIFSYFLRLLILFSLSTASFYLIEKPILKLKNNL
jgi:peptidoglycan/LPS O-acetylase OafA/YrhL